MMTLGKLDRMKAKGKLETLEERALTVRDLYELARGQRITGTQRSVVGVRVSNCGVLGFIPAEPESIEIINNSELSKYPCVSLQRITMEDCDGVEGEHLGHDGRKFLADLWKNSLTAKKLAQKLKGMNKKSPVGLVLEYKDHDEYYMLEPEEVEVFRDPEVRTLNYMFLTEIDFNDISWKQEQ